MTDNQLIFIISQPRSGSTLLQKIVSNNEYVDTVSEPWLLLPLLSIYKPELMDATYNFSVAAVGINDYLKKKELETTFRLGIRDLALNLYKVNKEGQYFLDKTPRYYEILPEILKTFPNAKYLILKRNPFASLSSMLFTWSDGKINYKKIKRFYRDFLIAPFRIQSFLEENKSLSNILEVKYELLVNDSSKFTNQIYDWLSIPFNEKVLDLSENFKVKGIYGDDIYKKISSEVVEDDNVKSWVSRCNKEPLRSFFIEYSEYLTQEFLFRYGYDTIKWKRSFFNKSSTLRKFLSKLELELK